MKLWLRCLILSVLFPLVIVSQPLRIQSVQIQRPTPAALSEWSRNPNIVRVFIQNSSKDVYSDIRVIFEIQRDGKPIVTMDPGDPAVPRFHFSPGITVLTGPDIAPPELYQSGGIDIADPAVERQALRTQQLPEGVYTYCVWLLDATGTVLHRYAVCPTFEILLPEPPILLSPKDRFDLPDPDRSPPLFQWTGIAPVPPDVSPQYRLLIVPVFADQSPREAIDRNAPLFEQVITGVSYQYQLSDPSFRSITGANRFAWQIQALDQFGRPIAVRGDNEGKSEIAVFGFASDRSSEEGETPRRLRLIPHWPQNSDTIPWRHPLLIVRFEPYSDSLRGARFEVVVEGEDVRLTNERNVRWPQGPARSQGVPPERATYHFVNAINDDGESLDWSDRLRRGQSYRWWVRATFRWADGSTTVVETEPWVFTLGLRKPNREAPPEMARFPQGTQVRLRWRTPVPAALNYTPEEMISIIRRRAFLHIPWAQEQVRVEVARDSDFRHIVTTATTQHPASDLYRIGDECAEFFQPRQLQTPPLSATGTYYWRVQYLDDDGNPYLTGPVWRFQIVGEESEPIDPATCLALRPLTPEGTIPVAQPVFRGVVQPSVQPAGIRRGWVKVWRMESEDEDSATVVARTPVFHRAFEGSDFASFAPYAAGAAQVVFRTINTTGATVTFTADVGQWYLWQFGFEVDAATVREDGVGCERTVITSRVARFRYQPDEGPCVYRCETPPVTNRTPRSEPLTVGDRIAIGAFTLTITQLENASPTALRGRGVIEIPAFRLPTAGSGMRLLVEFDDLQVNTDNQVYQGEARAVIADDAPLSAGIANAIEAGARDLGQEEIRSIDTYLRTGRRLLSVLSGDEPLTLPVGLDRVIGSRRVIIALVGAVFRPSTMTYPGGRLNVVAWIELPDLMGPGNGIGIGARAICFHPGGLNLVDGILYLPADIVLSDREDRGDVPTWEVLFRGWRSAEDRGTYLEWDCSGFRTFQLDVEVAFSRHVLLPIDAAGQVIPDPTQHVRGRATARLERSPRSQWGFVLEGQLQECALTQAPGFRLRGSSPIDFAIDVSAHSNPRTLRFPSDYRGAKDATWMGFYLSGLFLQLPDEFHRAGATEGPRVGLEQVLIDDTGVTLTVEATNVADNVDFNNWGGSIDTLRLRILQSAFREALIHGRLSVPVSDSTLDYRGLLNRSTTGSLSFVFQLRARDTLNFPLTRIGRLAVLPSSTFELRVESGRFLPTVLLNGQLRLAGDLPRLPGVDFRGVDFEGFGVRSVGDRIQFESGNWAFASPQHTLAGFPLSIREVRIVTGDCEGQPGAALRFGVDLNLFAETSAGISGGTTVSFWGALQRAPRWRLGFCQVRLDEIRLAADLGAAASIEGRLSFYSEDPTFGNGFRGEVSAEIAQLVSASGVVQFGAVSDYRYWFVDVRAYLPAGIPVGAGLGIYGFGGGAWYNMRRVGEVAAPPTDSRTADPAVPGATASGFRFIPDGSGAFGLRAMVALGTHPDPFVLNSDVTLEAEFSTGTGGGIRFMRLQGDYWMLCRLDQRRKAPLWGTLVLQLNFEPSLVLDGTFEVNIDAPRGAGLLRGGGQMVLHVASDSWYFWIGRPTARVGVSLGIGDLRLPSVGSYFQMGTHLDPIPPLPEEVVALLGAPPPMLRNSALISEGRGMAFGQELRFDSGRLQFLVFYARLRFLMGYDVSLLDYRGVLRCEGYSEPGLNGWYASGQVYAYVAGEVGMHVDVWFFEGNVSILELETAARLTAGMPNPTWLEGAVGGRFSVLGGVIKGYCNFEFHIGNRCSPPRLTPFELDMIADLQPQDGAQNVSVFVSPQAAFNFVANQPFEIEELDEDGEPRIRTFRLLITEFTLRRDRGGRSPLLGRWTLDDDRIVATLEPDEMLAGNTWHRVRVAVKGQEWTGGRWQDVRKADGSLAVQTMEHRFRTGPAPDRIPESNIASMYPRKNQRYFLIDQCPDGFIQLRRGMRSLLAEEGYRLKVRFIPAGSRDPVEVNATYSRRRIRFPIPSQLQTATIYGLQVLKVRVQERSDLIASRAETDYGIRSRLQERWVQFLQQRGTTVELRQRRLPSLRTRSGEKLMYVYHFRTSRYRTLQQKISAIFQGGSVRAVAAPSGLVTGIEYRKPDFAGEWFDIYDLRWLSGGIHPRDVQPQYPRTSLYWRQRVEPWLYQPVRRIAGFGTGGRSPLMLDRMTGVSVSGLMPKSPLQEWEIRDAYFPNPYRIIYRLNTGLPTVTVRLDLPAIAWWDYGTFARPRAARLLVEDAFIRAFEQRTGHRWDRRNRKERAPITGQWLVRCYAGRSHTHMLELLGLNPAHFPWALNRKLRADERRIVQRIASGTWNPTLYRSNLSHFRHWAVAWHYWGGSCAPAPDRTLPPPALQLLLLP